MNIIVNGDLVEGASSGFGSDTGQPEVNITLAMKGGRAMQKATSGNLGRRLGVLFVEQKSKSVLALDENGNEVTETFPANRYGHRAQMARCKTIGDIPTSLINGGNASVVNGNVVYDPTQ